MSAVRVAETMRQDVRYTLRTMGQQPGFAAGIVLTMALAIGGQRGDILRLMVRQSFRLALVVVGIAGAWGLTRLMRSLLFQVSATDPATFAVVGLLFLFVALLASYIPARRAMRIDPVSALRI